MCGTNSSGMRAMIVSWSKSLSYLHLDKRHGWKRAPRSPPFCACLGELCGVAETSRTDRIGSRTFSDAPFWKHSSVKAKDMNGYISNKTPEHEILSSRKLKASSRQTLVPSLTKKLKKVHLVYVSQINPNL